MSLLTKYPLWFLVFAILLGVGYAVFLYYKNNNITFEKWQRILMASLRGAATSLIAFLLLAPMLKRTKKETDKPVIVIASDNSESVASTKDSAFYLNVYQKNLQTIVDDLENDYEVKFYNVGDKNELVDNDRAGTPFSDKTTNLSSIFDEIRTLYSNRNVGALVMLTDGIYNTGANPYYPAQKTNFPVYTVGLGSDEQMKDLLIADIVHNKEVLKGNKSPVEIKVQAGKLQGRSARLTVHDGQTEVFSRDIKISNNRYFETVTFHVNSEKPGLQRFTVALEELEGEVTHKNNHAQFFIRVVESREKIAILYDSPHPDIAAIRSALEISDNYDIEVLPVEEFKGDAADYSLVVMHQLPSKRHPAAALLKQIRQDGVSALYLIGANTDFSSFNSLGTGLQVTRSKDLTNNATPSYNSNFMLFSFSEESQRALPSLPPLQTPFGDYKAAVSSNTFMTQKISGVETQYPLIVFSDANGSKTGVIAGTGVWSWKIYDHVNNGNHETFNEIIGKTALFLGNRSDKSPFRVRHSMVFSENAPVEFFAELYNQSGELVNTPDVKMTVKGRGDTAYEAQFSKQDNAYRIAMGELPVGTYTWKAETQLGGRKYEKSGSFSVQEIFVETANLVADFDLLKNIANVSGGKFFKSGEMLNVVKEIKDNGNIKPIASYRKKYSPLLDSPWYIAAIILLLGVEWFLRKWNGGF